MSHVDESIAKVSLSFGFRAPPFLFRPAAVCIKPAQYMSLCVCLLFILLSYRRHHALSLSLLGKFTPRLSKGEQGRAKPPLTPPVRRRRSWTLCHETKCGLLVATPSSSQPASHQTFFHDWQHNSPGKHQ